MLYNSQRTYYCFLSFRQTHTPNGVEVDSLVTPLSLSCVLVLPKTQASIPSQQVYVMTPPGNPSHRKLASTSKTLIKLSSMVQSANFESLPFVLQTVYILRTSITLPDADSSTLLAPRDIVRAVKDDARPGIMPPCHPMAYSPLLPPPAPAPATASIPRCGASNAPVAKTANKTEKASARANAAPLPSLTGTVLIPALWPKNATF